MLACLSPFRREAVKIEKEGGGGEKRRGEATVRQKTRGCVEEGVWKRVCERGCVKEGV